MMYDMLPPSVLQAFAPTLVLVSAGFDAHEHDPINCAGGRLKVQTDDYEWVVGAIDQTLPSTKGRVVSVLEGGYVNEEAKRYS